MAKQKSSEDLRYNGLTVPKFEEGDSAKFWLEKFNKAGTLKKWNDDEKCIHFCFALGNHAEDWYSSLTEEVKNDFESLQEIFLGRFESGADRVFSYAEFLELTQGSDSVDCYVEKVLKCGRKLKKSDAELMDKIVHGLNKDVKNFVVMKEARNLEEVTKYARLGQSLTSVETSSVCSVRSSENEQKNQDIPSYGDSDRNHYHQKPVSAAEGPTSERREGQYHRQDRRRQRRPFQDTCEHCGRCTHISSACKFKNAMCYQCNQKGHLARMHRPYYRR